MTIEEALKQLKDYEYYTPYQELISFVSDWIEQFQSNYEDCLRSEKVDMLTELLSEIEEMQSREEWCDYATDNCIDRCGVDAIIRLKINVLKAEQEK